MDRINRTWQIREYREGDEHQILQLRRIIFGDVDTVRLKLSTWYWQFRDNPAGKAICLLAEDDGVVVGQYAIIPTRFKFFGKKITFALSCDTMIHPAYRKWGLFTALASELYNSLESDYGITTIWGFPNAASLPGFTRRLEWNLLAVFPLWILPIRPFEMIRSHIPFLYRKPSEFQAYESRQNIRPITGLSFEPGTRVIPDLTINSIERFDESFDELWNTHHDLAPVMQIRESIYLNWRYLEVPDFGYRPFAIKWKGRISGYLVIRLVEMMGHFFGVIVDIFPFPVVDYHKTEYLVRFARDYCKAHGAEFLTCLLPLADQNFLKKAGFKKVPEWMNPRKWYFGCRCPEEDKSLLAPRGNRFLGM